MTTEAKAVAEGVFDARMVKLGMIYRAMREAETACRAKGFSVAALLALDAARKDKRMSALAKALGVTLGAATNLCDELVDRKLLERERSTTDRRVVIVRATPEGKDLLDWLTADATEPVRKFTTIED
jgi:DNA-binding MarR family transcriptional regulator